MAAWTLVASVLGVLMFSGVTWETPWRRILEAFGVTLLFTACIVPLAACTMPRLAPALLCRLSVPVYWAVIIIVMIGLAMAGGLTAIGILRAIGYIRPGEALRVWLADSLRISIIMTLIFGVSATLFETLRARLDDATMALRTKERDEADARRVAAEAHLASLESRVQPHFLFNTLNSIAALVHANPSGAERMTTQLASLLRSSLDHESPLVPLEDELHVVRSYLDIERVRFGDRLRYTIDVDAADVALGGARVPRLAIQTLVENSVKYAVSPRREGGSIAIRAHGHGSRVQLEVHDDGPGFDAARVPDGHGLSLLRSRLTMLFGDNASLAIDSRSGQTRVVVDVPSGTSG